jgi:TPR repeat protein
MALRSPAYEKRTFINTLKSARFGLREAQYEVGLMYANGIGVEQDFEQAIHWIIQSSERGYAAAQYLLATRYASGVGIGQDNYKAAVWFQKAGDQGHAKALYRLARLYGASLQDLSHHCMAKAAELGLADAQHALGLQFASGKGVRMDEKQAAYWHGLAAEQGLAAAQCALADLHGGGFVLVPPGDAAELSRSASRTGIFGCQRLGTYQDTWSRSA